MVQDETMFDEIPFLTEEGSMFFVCADSEAETRLGECLSQFHDRNDCSHFHIVDLKAILKGMGKEMVSYLFPGIDSSEDIYRSICDWILKNQCAKEQKPRLALVRVEEDEQLFTPLDCNHVLESLMTVLGTPKGHHCLKKESIDSHMPDSVRFHIADSHVIGSLANHMLEDASLVEPEPLIELDPDPKTQAILDAIERLNDEYGISLEQIQSILAQLGKAKLSRLRVDLNGKITLVDYGNREIDLDTLSKALYILFLKHPEGISYKCLSDYRDELYKIYSRITNKGSKQEIISTVAHLTNPFNTNQVCIHVARIKKAFLDIMGDSTAESYYIKGRQGYPKSISLDRGLVEIDF